MHVIEVGKVSKIQKVEVGEVLKNVK